MPKEGQAHRGEGKGGKGGGCSFNCEDLCQKLRDALFANEIFCEKLLPLLKDKGHQVDCKKAPCRIQDLGAQNATGDFLFAGIGVEPCGMSLEVQNSAVNPAAISVVFEKTGNGNAETHVVIKALGLVEVNRFLGPTGGMNVFWFLSDFPDLQVNQTFILADFCSSLEQLLITSDKPALCFEPGPQPPRWEDFSHS